jgi:hypothetical protein
MHRLGLRDIPFLANTAAAGGAFDPESIGSGSLELWLDASQEAYSDGDTDETFTNWSSHGSARGYAAVNGITYKTGITPQGTSVMRYQAGGGITGHVSIFNLSAISPLPTDWTMFMVFNVIDHTTNSNGGPLRFGGGTGDWVTFAGDHYISAFSTDRKNYTPSAGVDFDTFQVITVQSRVADYRVWVDGGLEFTDATHTVQTPNQTHIGSNATGNGFGGDFAELLCYDGELSGADIAIVEAYLQSKHIA